MQSKVKAISQEVRSKDRGKKRKIEVVEKAAKEKLEDVRAEQRIAETSLEYINATKDNRQKAVQFFLDHEYPRLYRRL
jgi:hypothetical protein